MIGMIERVARAIEPETFRRQDIAIKFLASAGREWEGSPEQETHRVKIGEALARARAAIEAMKEPTDAMKLAGGFKCEAIMFEDDPDGTGVVFNDMGHVYKAMVKVALQEGP